LGLVLTSIKSLGKKKNCSLWKSDLHCSGGDRQETGERAEENQGVVLKEGGDVAHCCDQGRERRPGLREPNGAGKSGWKFQKGKFKS